MKKLRCEQCEDGMYSRDALRAIGSIPPTDAALLLIDPALELKFV
jgi:hypothetical protein